MEIPTGVTLRSTADGVRVAIEGRRRSVSALLGLVALAAIALFLPAGLALITGAFAGIGVGILASWSLCFLGVLAVVRGRREYGVVELGHAGLRVFAAGGWRRIPWDALSSAEVDRDRVLVIRARGGTVRIPASESATAARWLVHRIGTTLQARRGGTPVREAVQLERLRALARSLGARLA